ncbi:MAG TPA: hemerythrin [Desulfobacteraceae bacterium]|nr:hemerythrin [Desulfobacteraceae bacterium]
MPLFEWKKEHSVGVYEMDRHHQKLFDILNRLHDAMKDGKGMQIIAGIVRELLDYTRYHFGEEEKLLEKIGYSGISEQKMAHQKFISQIEGYKEQADKGMTAFLSSGVSTLLTDWLRNHIGVMDKRYQSTMNTHGIK